MTVFKIDWSKDSRKWRIFTADGDEKLAEVNQVNMHQCTLVNQGKLRAHHGWAMTSGTLTVKNDVAYIQGE